MTEQFISILESQKEPKWIAFLQSLSPEQKKKLSPEIKKICKEYSEFGQLRGNSFGYLKGTDKQRHMLQIACFVCYTRSDYEKSLHAATILEKDNLNRIIDWYCPSWFSDYVNKMVDGGFLPFHLNYDWVMELTEKGFLHPEKELLVRTLPRMIFEQDNKRTWHFKPENALKRKITLEEHIWYIFELESNIHDSERYLFFGENAAKENVGWITLFKKFANEKRIDRSRLLKESLLAGNRNFNKVLSGWFAELFIELQATKEEILSFQKELLSALGSPHSKIVNTALQAIKKITAEKEFDITSFLDNAPILLSSDTKSVITSGLMILEKLAQKHPEQREKICLLSCQAFIQADDELQTRAAKIIVKHGDDNDVVVRKEIAAYHENMMASPRKMLANFYDSPSITVEHTGLSTIEADDAITTLNQIQTPENIDDLIFLSSQAFDNNEPWHFDILISALVKFNNHIKSDDVARFEPSFQRAFGLTKNAFVSTAGHLDHLLAIFFIDFGNYLIRKYPGGSSSIEKIYRKQSESNGFIRTNWIISLVNGSHTERWKSPTKVPFYEPFKKLLLEALDKIKHGDELPLLSSPNFLPCWITPETLIDRLSAYQQAGKLPGAMDLQLAISRCYLRGKSDSIKYATEKLSGEFLELMHFILDENASPKGPFHDAAAWMVASLSKKDKKTWEEFNHFSYYRQSINNYTGQLNWHSIDEPHTSSRYDYQAGKYVAVYGRRKILRVHRDNDENKNSLKNILSWIFSFERKKDPPQLYDFLHFRGRHFFSEVNDIIRILSLIPNNPEALLIDIINKSLLYPTFTQEGDKKMVTAALQFLYDVWHHPGEMSYLFLGTSMLCSDKTASHTAAELWLKAVSIGKIDNAKLGSIIGLHESIEFAPLKRFTDLISQNLWRVSALHDQELKKLIENILLQLPETPIKNLKKLNEIYAELNSR